MRWLCRPVPVDTTCSLCIYIYKHQNVLYCCHVFARVSQTTEPGGWRDSGRGWSLCVVQLGLAEGEQREKTPGGKTPSKAFPGRENRLLCLNCSPPVRQGLLDFM